MVGEYEISHCARFAGQVGGDLEKAPHGTGNGHHEHGRPIAILAAINEANLEESLAAFRQARAVEAVTELQQRSLKQRTDKTSMSEIDAEIEAVRKKRTR
jgi:hypothetical protein